MRSTTIPIVAEPRMHPRRKERMALLITILSNPKRMPPKMETIVEIKRFHRKGLEVAAEV
jgi:hypothetical protein